MNHLKALIPYLRRYALELIVGFAFMLLQNYSLMKSPIYMNHALDEIIGQNRGNLLLADMLYIALYTAVTFGSMFVMRKLIIGVSRKIEYDLRERLYRKILTVKMAFFQENQTGDISSRCTNDLDAVRGLLGPGIMYVPNSLSRLAFFLPKLMLLNRPLMLIVVGILLVISALIVVIMPSLRPLHKQVQEHVGAINNRVWQVISGITTLKLYTLEAIETQRFETLNQEYIRRQMKLAKTRGFLWPFFLFVFSLTELLILWIGGKNVISGSMTIGQLLQFNVMVAHLTMPVMALGWVMTVIQQGISAMGRLNHILDAPVEERADWKTLETDELVFTAKNLAYRYPSPPPNSVAKVGSIPPTPALSTEERPLVLRGLDFTITPGQTVAITGTIGSGKTTLINLMSGLFQAEPGMLFINGIDVRDIQPASLLQKISVVPQETFLFSRTIAENIALSMDGETNLDLVERAAKNAGLDGDIQTFPDKYEQVIGERGITLSGGQKQRTAIARALMKQSPVLIFDDALSSVDAKTEAHILDNLKALHSFKTLIIISHRISALRNADVIYVLDQGNILERGTHAELLEHGGLYARLAKMQQMEEEFDDER